MPSRRSRRILFVAHAFEPDSSAGVELYTARLARGLQQRGWEPTVLVPRLRPGRAQYARIEERVGGLPVVGVVQNYPYQDLPEAAADPVIDRVVDAVLGDLKPDLIAIQTLAGLSVGILARAAARGIPVVLHLHDGWWACASGGQRRHPDGELCLPVDKARCGACFDRFRHREGPLERAGRWAAGRLPGVVPPDAVHRAFAALPDSARGALKRLNEKGARRTADGAPEATAPGVDPRIEARDAAIAAALPHVAATFSPTAFLAESLQGDGLVFPGVAVVPTGVPTDPRPPVAPTSDGPLRALFVGTWVPHKGPQVFAEALRRTTAPVQGRALGPDPFPQFRAEVEAIASGRLQASGALPPEAVAAAMDEADVLVVPSVWAENAPLVILEARGRGRPVFASDLGGLPELIEEGVDGRLFPAGDAPALATLLDDVAGVRALQSSVRPPRSLEDFCADVGARYEAVLR
ncbi:MAG: glycosyltransferase family 4 protein [Proteobacteria bacterium]|nr:glycosyltransferase family 4 protein [Pseudomonadota bacterium]